MISNYINPSENLIERPYFPKNSPEYLSLKDKIFTEFLGSLTTYYCPQHHSVETRHSICQHQNCDYWKRSDILGITFPS